MDYFGKWTKFQIQGKKAVMHIESEKKKPTGFNIFDKNNVTKESGIIAKVEKLFALHQNKQVKVIAFEGWANEYEGKIKASELSFINLVVDEVADPEPVKEEPVIQRETAEPINEEDDLPF
jgi:hypothetical protein